MRFVSKWQHSENQLQHLYVLNQKKDSRNWNEDFFLVASAAGQGLPQFNEILPAVQSKYDSVSVQKTLQSLAMQWQAIQTIPLLKQNQANKILVSQMYALDEVYFERGKKFPQKMIVIFTTMYNNFYVSNLVLLSLLQELGISILILKDASQFNYLRGAKGFGENPQGILKHIEKLRTDEGIREVYITGFSSSGYISLYISTQIECDGYLGFSIRSDLSADSNMHSGKFFTKEIRKLIDEKWLVNLKPLLLTGQSNTPRKIFFGAEAKIDAAHARHLQDVRNMNITSIGGCGHVTPAPLLAQNRLLSEFDKLIF